MSRRADFTLANDQLRYALNEFKAIEEHDNFADRSRLMIRLKWLVRYLNEAGLAPEAKKIIREANSIPVQS